MKKQGITNEPFEIDLGDGESIFVEYPDSEVTLMLSQLDEKDTLGQLRVLFNGRQRDFSRLIDAMRGLPAQVINVLVEEMYEFWNNDSQAIPGKRKQ